MNGPTQVNLLFGTSVYSFATQRSDLISSTVLKTHHWLYTTIYCQSVFSDAETHFTFSLERQQQCLTYSLHFFFRLYYLKVRLKNQ